MCLFSGGFRQEEVAVAGRVSWQLLCPGRAGSAFGCPALIRAAMAGWVRSMSRQRPRSGPMRPMGIPSSALILASGTGGSSIRSVSSRWQPVGRWAGASRNAVWRSANWSSCSGSCPAVAAVASGMFAACGVCPWACGRRAACQAGRIPARWRSPARRKAWPGVLSNQHRGQPPRDARLRRGCERICRHCERSADGRNRVDGCGQPVTKPQGKEGRKSAHRDERSEQSHSPAPAESSS